MATEAKEIFEASSLSVRHLLSDNGLGLYIPPYQRPYGWDKEKVGKLIDDTIHGYAELVHREESYTFLGTVITIHDRDYKTVQPIVRSEVPRGVFTVIDGQQRLTSLLLWCVALHSQIQTGVARLLKGKDAATLLSHDKWLHQQAQQLLSYLWPTFVEEQPYGDPDATLYPRMIRAFDDQWSRTSGRFKYESPIARFIYEYTKDPKGFKPTKRPNAIPGEDALLDRYGQMSRLVRDLWSLKADKEELAEVPQIAAIISSQHLQEALLNHPFPKDVLDYLHDEPAVEYVGLLHVVLIAGYVLNRVAVTVVRGKNEDYAFTVFESLNTTGEPLTAFETFKPRVVSAEGLQAYEQSKGHEYMSEVSDYLARFNPGDPLQDATRDLLLYFANAETGEKLSKRLADQRKYMKEEFERHETDRESRIAFIKHLRDTALFVQYAWAPKAGPPNLHLLPVACSTDLVKLCLRFLSDLGHSVVIGPLVRFYTKAMNAASDAEKVTLASEFEKALLAITAFSVLWRSSRRGTANIDQEYREIMQGTSSLTGMAPLCRVKAKRRSTDVPEPQGDLTKFKVELRARLSHADHGGLGDRNAWVRDASFIPAYQNSRIVTRFLLLAAYHDSAPDPAHPGLIKPGKQAVSPCLTYDGWISEATLSLEHVAPRSPEDKWPAELYQDKEAVHRIGNLVLIQTNANASLSNRPLAEKKILYRALGAATQQEARSILEQAATDEISFAQTTQTLVELSTYMPHLIALGSYDSDTWSEAFINERSGLLLGMAWDRLYPWLE